MRNPTQGSASWRDDSTTSLRSGQIGRLAASGLPATVRTWGDGLASGLLVAAVIADFGISSMALTYAGLGYDSPGGAAWQKFHPATYLAMLAFVAAILSQPRPIGYLQNCCIRFPGAAYFIMMWLLLTAYGVLVQKMPLTSLVEPYLLALVALFMVDDLSSRSREFLRVFLHTILLANAVVGVIELTTQTRLFPYVISGVPVIGDTRSTALLGHPLANAATTGVYLLCLYLGGDRKVTPIWRTIMMAVAILGLIAFGGRTAIIASGLIIAAKLVLDLVLIVLGARLTLKGVLGAALVAPVVLVGVIGAAYAGLFDSLIDRFVDDNGSAQARVIVLQLFDIFDFNDLLLGPPPDLINSALKSFGIEIGIESTWLALIFQYGLLMTGFFVAGLFCLFWEFWRRSRSGASLLFLYFLFIISSATGLASKTMVFAQFAILLLFLFDGKSEARNRDQSPE
jgi:hypothetical protein